MLALVGASYTRHHRCAWRLREQIGRSWRRRASASKMLALPGAVSQRLYACYKVDHNSAVRPFRRLPDHIGVEINFHW